MDLTPARVFRHRDVAALAADLAATNKPAAASSPSIQRVNRDAYRRQL
jgi:hypothetical protein